MSRRIRRRKPTAAELLGKVREALRVGELGSEAVDAMRERLIDRLLRDAEREGLPPDQLDNLREQLREVMKRGGEEVGACPCCGQVPGEDDGAR